MRVAEPYNPPVKLSVQLIRWTPCARTKRVSCALRLHLRLICGDTRWHGPAPGRRSLADFQEEQPQARFSCHLLPQHAGAERRSVLFVPAFRSSPAVARPGSRRQRTGRQHRRGTCMRQASAGLDRGNGVDNERARSALWPPSGLSRSLRVCTSSCTFDQVRLDRRTHFSTVLLHV